MKDNGKKPREVPLESVSGAPSAPRAPRAFDLGAKAGDVSPETEARRKRGKIEIEENLGPDPLDGEGLPVSEMAREPGLFSLSSLFWTAVSLLVTLYLIDAAWGLVVSLEAKSPWVGQAALALIGIVVLGVLVFLGREALALFRMRKVAGFRDRAAELLVKPEQNGVRAFVVQLEKFYVRDAASATGRAEVTRALDEMHDPRTLLVIAERALLKTKDDAARRTIADAAQRVSMITALSPRAIVDVLFVLVQSVGLIRRLSAIYGGRASGVGLLRLAARVVSHLAMTGGMAVADSMVGQFLGAGIAARLSAKLGEGVLNGVLTARVGIAAIDLCRPLPFVECDPVKLSEVVKNIFTQTRVAENPAV